MAGAFAFGFSPVRDRTQLIVRNNAIRLSEHLIRMVLKNWRDERSKITPSEYKQLYESNPDNYGIDKHDPYNIMILDRDDGDHKLVRCTDLLSRVPMLLQRRDTTAQLARLFPMMETSLIHKFNVYRAYWDQNEENATEAYTQFCFPHQLAAMVRLILNVHPYWDDKPHLWSKINMDWGHPPADSGIQIGVIKMTGDGEFSVVTFYSQAVWSGFPEFDKLCGMIRLAESPVDLDPCTFRIWCRTGQQGSPWDMDHARVAEARDFTFEASGSSPRTISEGSLDQAQRTGSIIHTNTRLDLSDNVQWVYRPLDMSDVNGQGPFDVNTWFAVDY